MPDRTDSDVGPRRRVGARGGPHVNDSVQVGRDKGELDVVLSQTQVEVGSHGQK